MAHCVAVLSGGLDSMLAIRIMHEQGVEVDALNFKTIFECCQDRAGQAARWLGVRLTVIAQEDDYLDIVRNPRFGYGKGANPCVDCRIYMFQLAKRFMEDVKADFIVSGEVAGQRPMSQKRRDLDAIAYHSDLEDLLLRPLSAKLLAPTKPEREGWVDRSKLYEFSGRSRKGLIQLAKEFGFEHIPDASTGCALTEVQFSHKVHDLLQLDPNAKRWDFEALKVGRHFRFNETTKVIVGRNEEENAQLEYMHNLPEASSTALLFPYSYLGALCLIIGPPTDEVLQFAGGLLYRYGKAPTVDDPQVEVIERDRKRLLSIAPTEMADRARTLAAC
jgi:tRNA(Ile)-lysidine synthase TilS/MesJ